jgi:hypothetical protein
MKWIFSILLAALLAMAGDGLAPRGGPSDYPAHASAGRLTLAVAAVSVDQAKKVFGARIDQAGYLAFEVALYPEPGSEVAVSLSDFALRLGEDGSSVRAAEPDVIAAATIPAPGFEQSNAQDNDKVTVAKTNGIGTAAGGTGTIHGVQGATRGDYSDEAPPPPSAGAKAAARKRLDQSLTSRQLPAGRITQPVAGYLYFPKPPGRARKDSFQLSWLGENTHVTLIVPPLK